MKFQFPKFDKVAAPVLFGLAVALFAAEITKPLRRRTRPLQERLPRNASVAALALPALRLLLLPALYKSAKWSEKHQIGLLWHLPMPKLLRNLLALLLLDYSSYLWHLLLHRSSLLWRFHNVHHTDLDLDLSTAWRFHVGENIASVPVRGGMAALIGPPPAMVVLYEALFEGCTAFHHSNWRLPFRLEQFLCNFMVTPRMHGIHHSVVKAETESNFSVCLNIWDRLHRSLRLHVPQQEIIIGVPSYRNPEEQSPLRLLIMPFEPHREWLWPDGSEVVREGKEEKHVILKE